MRVLAAHLPIAATIKLPSCSAPMARRGVPLEQLLADSQRFHSYLLQDPCADPRAQAYVAARISYFHNMSSRRSGCTGSGELDGLRGGMSSSGPTRSSDSRKKAIVTI